MTEQTGHASEKEPSGAAKVFGDFAPALVSFTDDTLFGQVWPGRSGRLGTAAWSPSRPWSRPGTPHSSPFTWAWPGGTGSP